jgi:hypothetical protein
MKARDSSLTGKIHQEPRDLDMKPETVFSLLEEDQLFAAKQRALLGQARLSRGTRVLMWCLRGYVILMLIVVVVAIVHATHGGGGQ